MTINSEDIVPLDKRDAFQLGLLQDAIEGLQEIRAGKPEIDRVDLIREAQQRIDAAMQD